MLNIGRMDRLIRIQSLIVSQNGYGEEIESWVTVAQVWAQVADMRGSERFLSEQRQEDRVIIFKIRYLSSLTAKHRVIYEGRAYNILGLSEVGRRRGWEITAVGSDRAADILTESFLPLGKINISGQSMQVTA